MATLSRGVKSAPDLTHGAGLTIGLSLVGASGRVVVPPPEYDAATAETLPADELVDVATEGVVTSWSWNPKPRLGQPFDRPFAWALVQLDGADTGLLHALDAPRKQIRTGMRVFSAVASISAISSK